MELSYPLQFSVIHYSNLENFQGRSNDGTSPGKRVMLIGTSCAGKSTISRELQEILDEHYLLLGIDTFLHMVARQWGGAFGGPLSWEGFRYEHYNDGSDGLLDITIRYGAVGEKVLRGMHRAVAALAYSGNNVIVDEALLDRKVLEDWVVALRDLRVLIFQLWAPLTVLEERELARGNEPGLARGLLAFNSLDHWDLKIDTSVINPAECARLIAKRITNGQKATAMEDLRRHFSQ